MKLYNLLKEVIIEYNGLLTENVSKKAIDDALNSHKRIKIYYQGAKESNPEVRYVDVYAYGVSKAGNEVLRVYQAFGTTTSNIGWKLLRLDRISKWEPTGFRFSEKSLDNDPSIPRRNGSGDDSMIRVYSVAKFNNDSHDRNVKVNNKNVTQDINQTNKLKNTEKEPVNVSNYDD